MSQYLPQVVPTRRPLVFWLVSAAAVVFIVSLIVMAPIAAAGGHNERGCGDLSGVRHLSVTRRPDRSYFIDGHKLAVCSRCTGHVCRIRVHVVDLPAACVHSETLRLPREVCYSSPLFHC